VASLLDAGRKVCAIGAWPLVIRSFLIDGEAIVTGDDGLPCSI